MTSTFQCSLGAVKVWHQGIWLIYLKKLIIKTAVAVVVAAAAVALN